MTRNEKLTAESLAAEGFVGFVTFDQLRADFSVVPEVEGAYVVLRTGGASPRFLKRSPAGWHKGTDPTYPIAKVRARWVEGAEVLNVGKARRTASTNLRVRLKAYARFGAGANTGHAGGRAIWQLGDSSELLVAWVAARSGETAEQLEARYVNRFKREHDGRLPFANANDPSKHTAD